MPAPIYCFIRLMVGPLLYTEQTVVRFCHEVPNKKRGLMKKCSACHVTKDLDSFYTNGRQKVSGRQKYHPNCIECMLILRADATKAKRNIITEMFGDKCIRCGYNECYSALDFHHVDPSKKEYEPRLLVNGFGSIKKMLKELEKCVMLCSNCHRSLHAGVWTM